MVGDGVVCIEQDQGRDHKLQEDDQKGVERAGSGKGEFLQQEEWSKTI